MSTPPDPAAAVPATAASRLLQLPPDDRELSPYTGWTRAHLEATADGLVGAALRWATPRGALIDLPGPPSRSGVRSDGLEGYARTFLAAAFRVAGAGGADPHGRLERYADGLAAGTRTPGRDDAESWPVIRDHTVQGQPMVEAASVALALRITRPWLWDALDEGVQDRVEEWLRDALRHVPAPNNWYLFPLSVAGFLDSAGRGDAETKQATERGLELLEHWWRGDGWYADGDGRSFDHYNGWALHLYPTLHAYLAGDEPLLHRLGERLRTHLDGLGPLFGGDGAPVYFGRSLTYRFAAAAAVGLGALTGHTPYRPGVSRRLVSGSVRYFLDRGALTDDGLLSLGWHGPHAPTLQRYSGPASPYWASKGLLALLVPAGDPLWTAPEEPAPSEGRDQALALPAPGLLIQTTGDDGIARLHNHGSDHLRPQAAESPAAADPLYTRYAYSTRTGPTSGANLPDNHFSVAPHPGGPHSARCRVHPAGAGSADGWGWAASWHTPAFPSGTPEVPGLCVESVTYVRGRTELRVHRVTGAPDGTRVRLTGWATGPEEASPVSRLHGLHGWAGPAETLRAPEGTAFTRWALVPALTGVVTGGTALFAALATLTAADAAPPSPDELPRLESAGTDALHVHWPGAATTTHIAFTPLSVTTSRTA